MGITLLTAVELATNYPDNILINAAKQENEKFSSFCYMTRNGQIHKLMLSTQSVFETEKEAIDIMTELAVECKQKYSNQ